MGAGVDDTHSCPALAANSEPTQQSFALARRARLFPARAVSAQLFPIAEVLIPGDVRRHAVPFEYLPLLHRHPSPTLTRMSEMLAFGVHGISTVHIRACVEGVMEHGVQSTHARTTPFQLAAIRPAIWTDAETDAVAHHVPEHGANGT